jgi:hypothetical protein
MTTTTTTVSYPLQRRKMPKPYLDVLGGKGTSAMRYECGRVGRETEGEDRRGKKERGAALGEHAMTFLLRALQLTRNSKTKGGKETKSQSRRPVPKRKKERTHDKGDGPQALPHTNGRAPFPQPRSCTPAHSQERSQERTEKKIPPSLLAPRTNQSPKRR